MQGCLGLGRLLLAIALFESVAALARAIAEPGPVATALTHFAAVARALLAGTGLVLGGRLRRYARALGLRPFADATRISFGLSALFALLPFFALVPESLGDESWDTLLQLGRLASLTAGVCLSLLLARAFARHEGLLLSARHLAASLLPALVCLPIALQAIDPRLLPSMWLGAGLALLLPWALLLVRLLRWDVACAATLAMLACGGALASGKSPGPLAITAVALSAGLLLAASTGRGALDELASHLGRSHADTVSSTHIRRLFQGTLGGEGSRVGDLDPGAASPSADEAREDAQHLALVYRELGLDAPTPAARADALPPSEDAPSSTIAPLVPLTREAPRPNGAEVIALPSAFGHARTGLRWYFGATVLRALLVGFGLLWSSSPLAEVTAAVVAFDLALLGWGACLAVGLARFRQNPLPAVRAAATLALSLWAIALLTDLLLGLTRFFPEAPRGLLQGVDGLACAASAAAMLVALSRLLEHLQHPKPARRARAMLALLAGATAFATVTSVVSALPESDLRWLAWPLGFATAAISLFLWIAFLWLLQDTRDALRA